MQTTHTDTIVAQATPPGRGGVGIIRVSGPKALDVAKALLNVELTPRVATYTGFHDANQEVIDQGIALYFKAPNSFTGEDVVEFQGHGGPVIMDMLLEAILQIKSVRLARPGEFSEQAFLNDKLDLAQAEAIADLIDASSKQAARSAVRSLQGDFSKHIHTLSEAIIHLRMYVEAAIDFPDEEIDFLSDGKVTQDLADIIRDVNHIREQAKQGTLLREGMQVVIAGRPNAGKSSLLNALAGRESAIVTDIAGTTRDVLKEHINVNGMPLHVIDTAGLRDSPDKVEQIGIARAWEAINDADRVLFVVDSTTSSDIDPYQIWPEFMQRLPAGMPVTVIRNKADISGDNVTLQQVDTPHGPFSVISLSANTGQGVELLRDHLSQSMGLDTTTEGQFIARRRHIDAIDNTLEHLQIGEQQLHDNLAGELLAEELRLAHQHLSEITGEFSSDDLLGRIFSSFCIGK
ncbi:tRNA modification GTPase [Marisediminitalea aggregata]|uniref:tRNA modification GTPase MnmE n=1 Tax=Marisediminitalea aggregata TaxID=634436 RepID=A0A1M5FNB1_9ALTE|nr:tRNA uridine-5-carboxymethylaminomethyl(34) synthesis GTPase MnmE [Marisediminitalea aggregata]MAP23806.1 tRNA uridine-5-carboxymethylaminomethyl(34) synthesis GTPase MnmE [Alteromonadaceae bacterium]MCP5008586.1 tRNA uridine-5-carboxymethylaminomethyl(34) synthesis GTPase MnmE [Aestuariibacter sp.]SHF92983.1 tRNA modification GTPase [Marisediminitalea aggregata]HBY38021.1 tRNA uridine-5-carboxymethylaminomethyl(34) synthesis GTPase MnmE [Alteromonas sp.]|tara:strand:- start:9325 stop:10707 length:1383 start_codon:yes stop_codon:yes gene_type:complete